MRVQSGGDGQPVLLLLHGLGATGDVWNGWPPVLSERWPGRWLAPDLPGHGGSEPLPRYSFGDLAASLADLVGPDDQLTVLGHSLGGVLGLTLAGDSFDVTVDTVVGVGIKVAWTDDELAKARALAERPVSWFATRDEAASRYLRVSGLTGLLTPDDAAVERWSTGRERTVAAGDGSCRLRRRRPEHAPAARGNARPDHPGPG